MPQRGIREDEFQVVGGMRATGRRNAPPRAQGRPGLAGLTGARGGADDSRAGAARAGGQLAVPEPPVRTALYLGALAAVLRLVGGSGRTPAPLRALRDQTSR